MLSLNVAVEDNHRNMKSCCLPVNKKGESLKKPGQLCARAAHYSLLVRVQGLF